MENEIIQKRLLEELEELFSLVSPRQLRQSLGEIFWAYLCNTDQTDLKPDLKELATDFHLVLQFLEIAEMYEKEKKVDKRKKE